MTEYEKAKREAWEKFCIETIKPHKHLRGRIHKHGFDAGVAWAVARLREEAKATRQIQKKWRKDGHQEYHDISGRKAKTLELVADLLEKEASGNG